jgi:hypothetical protein
LGRIKGFLAFFVFQILHQIYVVLILECKEICSMWFKFHYKLVFKVENFEYGDSTDKFRPETGCIDERMDGRIGERKDKWTNKKKDR